MDTTQASQDDVAGHPAPAIPSTAGEPRAVVRPGPRPVGPPSLLRRVARRAARILGVAALVAAVAVLAAVASGGEANLLVVLLAALSGWALPVTVLAAVLFALTRWWRATVLAAGLSVVAAGWLFQLLRVDSSVTPDSARSAYTVPLRVMSLNTEIGGADPQQLVDAVRRDQPDVLVLTELTPEAVAGLHAAGLDDVLPSAFARPGPNATGTGIWTRQPLTDQRQIPGTQYAALVGTLTVDGHPVTIAGVHPNAPTALDLWQSDYRILTQALDPRAAAAGGRGHEVVAGDFNAAVTNGPLTRLLGTGLQDTALAAWVPVAPWFGAGQTWPADYPIPPVIRIDHVLASLGTDVVGFDTFRVPNTDHLGVTATLHLKLD